MPKVINPDDGKINIIIKTYCSPCKALHNQSALLLDSVFRRRKKVCETAVELF